MTSLAPRLRDATAYDRPGIEALLHAADLPTAGLDDAFLVVAADERGALVGTAGLEVWGASGLLRSVAVAGSARGRGLGRTLVRRIEEAARERGVAEIALLTTTAAPFFTAAGWVERPRAEASPALQRSREWGENVCPGSARFLVKELRPHGSQRRP